MLLLPDDPHWHTAICAMWVLRMEAFLSIGPAISGALTSAASNIDYDRFAQLLNAEPDEQTKFVVGDIGVWKLVPEDDQDVVAAYQEKMVMGQLVKMFRTEVCRLQLSSFFAAMVAFANLKNGRLRSHPV